MTTGLLDGFTYLMVNTVFGSALLFAIVFLVLIIILLYIAKTSFDQILAFLLIPVWYFKDNLLGGLAGGSIIALLLIFNAFVLYKQINKLVA